MSNEAFEKFVRRLANKLGLDITRYRPAMTDVGRLATMLAHHQVDCMLDIGANTGQFATALRNAGYAGRIVSFEPLSSAHRELSAAAQRDELWTAADRVAVGDRQGETEIQIAGNSVSSSVLDMLDSHVSAAPASGYIGSEQVEIKTLDVLVLEYAAAESRTFIKIDTQGFESQVLDGAADTLQKATGVQLELSLVPLYAQQELFDELSDRMRNLGFVPWAIWPALFDPQTGRMIQADATFFRD